MKFQIVTFIISIALLSGCKVTEKTVGRPSSETGAVDGSNPTDPSGDAPAAVLDNPLVVTSHATGSRVTTGSIAFAGTCKTSLNTVDLSGDFAESPVQTACIDGKFSRVISLSNLNSTNTINVQQGADVLTVFLDLFVRAPFCGDGLVNQSFEKCDGSAGCDEFCQTASNRHGSNVVLARVVISSASSEGQGNVTEDIFLGTDQTSIPAGVWFPIFVDGQFFVDASTDGYNQVPGLAVRRIGREIKVLLKTSLSASDFEHVDGFVEFFNANASSVSSGFSGEALESEADGIALLSPENDEIFIESGRSHFWFSERIADDAFFAGWSF